MSDWYRRVSEVIDEATVEGVRWEGSMRRVRRGSFVTNYGPDSIHVHFFDAETQEFVEGTSNELSAVLWSVGDDLLSIRVEGRTE